MPPFNRHTKKRSPKSRSLHKATRPNPPKPAIPPSHNLEHQENARKRQKSQNCSAKSPGCIAKRPSFAIHRLQLLSSSFCRNSTQPDSRQNQAPQTVAKHRAPSSKALAPLQTVFNARITVITPSSFPSFCIKRHKIADKTAPTPAINAQAAFPLSEPPAQCQDTHPSIRLRTSPITSSLNTHATPNGTAECPPHL